MEFFSLLGLFWQALMDGSLSWRTPVWLWAVLLPPAVWFFKHLWIRRRKQQFADARLWPWVEAGQKTGLADKLERYPRGGLAYLTRIIKWIAPGKRLALAWLCLVIALAGPRSLQVEPDQPTRPGVDILVLMDLSHSMTATDVNPSRFLQARALVEAMTAELQVDDRLALMGFAGQPHLFSPLSFDRALFRHALHLMEPDMLPIQGSWIERALVSGINHLEQTGGEAKVMLILSDGAPAFWKTPALPETLADSPGASQLQSGQTEVKTVWIGMGKTAPVTLTDEAHPTGKLHAGGQRVQSRLEERMLQQWAQRLNGLYLVGGTGPEVMPRLAQVIAETAKVSGKRELTAEKAVWTGYSAPFMALGLLALLLAFYPLSWRASKRSVQPAWLVAGLPICLLVAGPGMSDAEAQPPLSYLSVAETKQEAYEAYQQGAFDLSAALYDRARDFEGYFGAGASAYRAGDLESAVFYFRQSAWMAESDSLRAQALFNLGNSYLLANLLPLAIESYRQALVYRSPYPKAAHNLELALLRQQQEEAGKQDKRGEEEEEGEKGEGRGDNGAFYGGQKPAGSDEPKGFGADVEAPDGKGEKKLILPQEGELTDYQLNAQDGRVKRLEQRGREATAAAILVQQRQRQQAEAFEHTLKQLKDEQKVLLKRLFEREAGFQAPQEKPHPIPGVQPW